MRIHLFIKREQLQALGTIRDLGTEKIKAIVQRLSEIEPPPMRPSELQERIADLLTEKPEAADTLIGQMLSLYTLMSERGLAADQLLEGLRYGIRVSDYGWSETDISKWQEMEPQLKELFSLPAVMTVVKTLDLSFDFENLLQNSKIITDIRPVFNAKASEIHGAIVSFTLRLYYDSVGGSNSLSIALDENDVIRLRDVCQRALDKAQTAKIFMSNSGINQTLISGGEE
jgi:hypothetical protein